MIRQLRGLYLAAVLMLPAASCSGGYEMPEQLSPDPDRESQELDENVCYDDEKERTAIPEYKDMVLAYGGSPHRGKTSTWDVDRCRDYLLYTDMSGESHLLFDSFLFLEFMYAGSYNGTQATNHTFTVGYQYEGKYLDSATKEDWQTLIDYYYETSGLNPEISPMDALEKAYSEVASELGLGTEKLGVVMTIPEPIRNMKHDLDVNVYWGELDGREMDFSRPEDRIRAVKWYINSVRKAFYDKRYEHLELGGFYWIAESASTSSDILNPIGEYLRVLKYSFNWIPYYSASGYDRWDEFGFSAAYLQPNYFFDTSVPPSRLDDACRIAEEEGMSLEMEFDENVLYGKADRLRSYMEYFKEYGAWDFRNLAYYVGRDAVRSMKNSSAGSIRQLYYDFCDWVVTRPVRDR